ncbi:MAG: hypothetical protein EOP50_08355 [Sphingobacteriales bacterium]|nr:MAG: hypothetical protein EOP50_08355 [Sphingobacteriales bacterium]
MKHISCITILLLSAACSKHSGDTTEQPADVRFDNVTPVINSHYAPGDTVWLQARAISATVLHAYEVSVQRAGDTAHLFFADVHDHNDTLDINQYWVNDQPAGTALRATFSVVLNHEGDRAEQVVPFVSQ